MTATTGDDSNHERWQQKHAMSAILFTFSNKARCPLHNDDITRYDTFIINQENAMQQPMSKASNTKRSLNHACHQQSWMMAAFMGDDSNHERWQQKHSMSAIICNFSNHARCRLHYDDLSSENTFIII